MRFIFIGGCGRSGTTMLQKILCSHSNIEGGPEFDFSGDMAALYKKMSSNFQLKRHEYFYNNKELKENFQKFMFSFFTKLKTNNSSLKFISEKTPTNINNVENLLDLFPDAYYLNIIRDGRDVYVSHKEVAERYVKAKEKINLTAFSVYGVSERWNNSIYRYRKLLDSKYSDRLINVYYEKLITDPKTEIERVCKILEINFENRMIDAEFVNENFSSKFNADELWYTKDKLQQNFNLQKIGRWKSEISKNERVELSILMNENLSYCGYEIENFQVLDKLKLKIKNKLKL